jgi:hypothetical protein
VTDPLPPGMPDVRDLTDDEYERTYADGTGGHQLPPDVLALLDADEQLTPEPESEQDGQP